MYFELPLACYSSVSPCPARVQHCAPAASVLWSLQSPSQFPLLLKHFPPGPFDLPAALPMCGSPCVAFQECSVDGITQPVTFQLDLCPSVGREVRRGAEVPPCGVSHRQQHGRELHVCCGYECSHYKHSRLKPECHALWLVRVVFKELPDGPAEQPCHVMVHPAPPGFSMASQALGVAVFPLAELASRCAVLSRGGFSDCQG